MNASADTFLSKAKELNLFEESVTDENPEVVRQGRIKTWIFLVLLPAGFIGYIIWALTSKQIIVVSAEPASYAQFRELSAAHPDLSCTCTQLSMPLTRILPPLPEQPVTVTAKVVGQMDVGNRRINFTEADSTNWIAAGFTMYDKWCSRVILEELDNPSGPTTAKNDQLGSYWGTLCQQNECCRQLRGELGDDSMTPGMNQVQQDSWVIQKVYGMDASISWAHTVVPSPFFSSWCSIAMQQRRAAVHQHWNTLLVSNTLIHEAALSLQLRRSWTAQSAQLQSAMRTYMTLKHNGCMFPGCPNLPTGGLSIDLLTQPLRRCNVATIPMQRTGLSKDHHYRYSTQTMPEMNVPPLAGRNASGVTDYFFELLSFAFVLDWQFNSTAVHEAYYAQCAPTTCTYQTQASGHLAAFLGVLLGVMAGLKDTLEVVINFLVPKLYCTQTESRVKKKDEEEQNPELDSTPAAARSDPSPGSIVSSPVLVHTELSPDSDTDEQQPLMRRSDRQLLPE